jgi:hypothetical protein
MLDELQNDPPMLEYGLSGPDRNAIRGTVYVQVEWRGRNIAALEPDSIPFNCCHATQSRDLLDPSSRLKFRFGDCSAAEHGGQHARVDSEQGLSRFKPSEEVVNRRCLPGSFHLVDHTADRSLGQFKPGLLMGTII